MTSDLIFMKRTVGILLLILLRCIVANAQLTAKQQAFNFLRGKLISLSTQDGHNGVSEITLNESNCTSTVFWEDKTYNSIFWANLDANTISWDIYNPNKNETNTFDKLIRITVASKPDYPARQLFEANGQIDNSKPTNRLRLLFSLPRAADVPDFQNKIEKAVKRLITLCGGEPENHLF